MRPLISLMYHNVCRRRNPDGTWAGFEHLSPSITSYFVDEEQFDRHCRVVATASGSTGTTTADRPTIQLTFDDGWKGTIDLAGPILEAYGLRGTMFVTTDLIGHPLFVNRAQLVTCAPTFSIGAHGRSHRLLATLNDTEVREELATSKGVLEDVLGCEVDTIAVPGGSYDERVVQIARETGYRQLFTSNVRINHDLNGSMLVGRIAIKDSTTDSAIERYCDGNLHPERRRQMAIAAAKLLLGRRLYANLRSWRLKEGAAHLEMTDLARSTTAAAVRCHAPAESTVDSEELSQ